MTAIVSRIRDNASGPTLPIVPTTRAGETARTCWHPNGVRSDVQWRVGIANTGEITAGSGPLRAPVVAGEVTTVALDEAMLRLGRIAQSLPSPSQPPPASSIAVTVAPDGDNAVPAVAPGTVAPATAAAVPFTLPTITSVEPALTCAATQGS